MGGRREKEKKDENKTKEIERQGSCSLYGHPRLRGRTGSPSLAHQLDSSFSPPALIVIAAKVISRPFAFLALEDETRIETPPSRTHKTALSIIARFVRGFPRQVLSILFSLFIFMFLDFLCRGHVSFSSPVSTERKEEKTAQFLMSSVQFTSIAKATVVLQVVAPHRLPHSSYSTEHGSCSFSLPYDLRSSVLLFILSICRDYVLL